jgi:transcriptional regulator
MVAAAFRRLASLATERKGPMYIPRHFEETRPEVLYALLQRHPLGLLITQAADGTPVVNPIPFLLLPASPGDAAAAAAPLAAPTPSSPTEPTSANSPRGEPAGRFSLHAHVARANPVWAEAADRPALVVFQGAEGYVSPNWYPSKAENGKAVPTWNYIVVEARGVLRVADNPEAAEALVTRLTAHHEASQPKPWGLGEAPRDYIDTMLRAIVPIELAVDSLVGKYKLSQNAPARNRAGVLQALTAALDAGAATSPRLPGGAAPAADAQALDRKAMFEHGGPG